MLARPIPSFRIQSSQSGPIKSGAREGRAPWSSVQKSLNKRATNDRLTEEFRHKVRTKNITFTRDLHHVYGLVRNLTHWVGSTLCYSLRVRVHVFVSIFFAFSLAPLAFGLSFDPNVLVAHYLNTPRSCAFDQPPIINGVVTEGFPAVIRLTFTGAAPEYAPIGTCSGTQVFRTGKILLSAHCLCAVYGEQLLRLGTLPDSIGGIQINDRMVDSPQIKIHPKYIPCSSIKDNDGPGEFDLAMIMVPPSNIEAGKRGPAPAGNEELLKYLGGLGTMPLSFDPPVKSASVTVVGYGTNYPGLPADGKKREGINQIKSVDPSSGIIELEGRTNDIEGWDAVKRRSFPSPNGLDASTAKGDSGGPLLFDGKIVGVTTRGATLPERLEGDQFLPERKLSYFTPVAREENQTFLRQCENW